MVVMLPLSVDVRPVGVVLSEWWTMNWVVCSRTTCTCDVRGTYLSLLVDIAIAKQPYWCSEIMTLCTKLRGTVYCNQSCLCVCAFICVFMGLLVCYHDNLKLHASIFTKLGLWVKLVTISSWLNFGRPVPPRSGCAAGQNFLAAPYYS